MILCVKWTKKQWNSTIMRRWTNFVNFWLWPTFYFQINHQRLTHEKIHNQIVYAMASINKMWLRWKFDQKLKIHSNYLKLSIFHFWHTLQPIHQYIGNIDNSIVYRMAYLKLWKSKIFTPNFQRNQIFNLSKHAQKRLKKYSKILQSTILLKYTIINVQFNLTLFSIFSIFTQPPLD